MVLNEPVEPPDWQCLHFLARGPRFKLTGAKAQIMMKHVKIARRCFQERMTEREQEPPIDVRHSPPQISVNPSGPAKDGHFFRENPSEKRQGNVSEASGG